MEEKEIVEKADAGAADAGIADTGAADASKSSAEDEGMSFWGHLEALRWTVFRMLVALVICVIAAFISMPYVFDNVILAPTGSDFFLYRLFANIGSKIPGLPDFGDSRFSVDIININVASQFMTHISTSFWLAIVMAFPYIIYEIWKFVRPALFPKEVSNMKMAFFFGTVMFYIGCAVGYCIVFPFTFRFLVEYRISEQIVNQINLSSYINNFLLIIFVMGIVFELPLLAWILSKLGIIDREFLVTYRKYAIVILLVLAAVITPSGDPFTLSVVFVPLYFLYELSVRLVHSSKHAGNRERRTPPDCSL